MSVIVSATINKRTPPIKGGTIADEIYGEIAYQVTLDPSSRDDLRQAQYIAEDFLQAHDKTFSLIEAGEHVRKTFHSFRTSDKGGNPKSVEAVIGTLGVLYRDTPTPRRQLVTAMKEYAFAMELMAHSEADRQARIVIDNCVDVLWPEEKGLMRENRIWLESRGISWQSILPLRPGEFEVEFTYGDHTLTFMTPIE